MTPTEWSTPHHEVLLNLEGIPLRGDLAIPRDAPGIVVFAHGSGSSRKSPRNRRVAEMLSTAGIGTLLFDLLTPAEERDRENVFDIPLLARRLLAVTRWLAGNPDSAGRAIGYFGASTGAGAALMAAATSDVPVSAIVSRGGRPDLAGAYLPKVRAPTLLIVGGRDPAVLELNRIAYERLACPKRLEVVPSATHLFEEPGALQAVSALATDWFLQHLAPATSEAAPGPPV